MLRGSVSSYESEQLPVCICMLGVMYMCVRGHVYVLGVMYRSCICVLGVMYMCARGHAYVC